MGTCEKKTVTALPQRKIRGKDPQDGSFNSLLKVSSTLKYPPRVDWR